MWARCRPRHAGHGGAAAASSDAASAGCAGSSPPSSLSLRWLKSMMLASTPCASAHDGSFGVPSQPLRWRPFAAQPHGLHGSFAPPLGGARFLPFGRAPP